MALRRSIRTNLRGVRPALNIPLAYFARLPICLAPLVRAETSICTGSSSTSTEGAPVEDLSSVAIGPEVVARRATSRPAPGRAWPRSPSTPVVDPVTRHAFARSPPKAPRHGIVMGAVGPVAAAAREPDRAPSNGDPPRRVPPQCLAERAAPSCSASAGRPSGVRPKPSLLPKDYTFRQVYASFQHDETVDAVTAMG